MKDFEKEFYFHDFELEPYVHDGTYTLNCFEMYSADDGALVDCSDLTKEDLWRLKIMLDKFFMEEN